MTTFGNRFKSLRLEKNMTQEILANAFNVKYHTTFNKSTISQYENDKRKPEVGILENWADFFDVSIDYLLCRTNLRNSEENIIDTHIDDINLKNEIKIDNVVKLPVLGSVRAGVGGLAVEEVIGYEYAFNLPADASDYFYLKVKGDSMEPKISEGDLALVKKQCDVESGELAIVLINGDEGVIKKVIKTENHTVELHSFNAYYPARIFSGAALQNLKIIGKVINTTRQW